MANVINVIMTPKEREHERRDLEELKALLTLAAPERPPLDYGPLNLAITKTIDPVWVRHIVPAPREGMDPSHSVDQVARVGRR